MRTVFIKRILELNGWKNIDISVRGGLADVRAVSAVGERRRVRLLPSFVNFPDGKRLTVDENVMLGAYYAFPALDALDVLRAAQ